MASHYNFHFAVNLENTVSADNWALIRYLVEGHGPAPQHWPVHPVFAKGLPRQALASGYRETFADGEFVCKAWTNPMGFRGVHLYLPGDKLEGVYDTPFFLAHWLATLSLDNGCVGSITCSDDGKGLPTLLFVYANALHMERFDGRPELIEL